MSYSFKYNKGKGTYEVLKDAKVVKECRTMQEAKTFIDEKASNNNKKPKSDIHKGKEIGFGQWGVPNYLLKAEAGVYGIEQPEKE